MGSGEQWTRLKRRLDELAREVAEEISAYPAPITACDAQFNRLLELRRILPQERRRLEIAAADPAATIESFLRASPCATELTPEAGSGDAGA